MWYGSSLIDINADNGGYVTGAKNDSFTLRLDQKNSYSKTLNIEAIAGSNSGILQLEACRIGSECSKIEIPIYVSDLPNQKGKKPYPAFSVSSFFPNT